MKRVLLAAALASLSSLAFATVTYSVQVEGDNALRIKVEIPIKSDETSIQIPNWAPGSYRYQDFPARVSDVSAAIGSGSAEVSNPDKNTWTAKTPGRGNVTFSYKVPVDIQRQIASYAGPANYVYVVGRKEEDIKLIFDLPENWRVACGLDEDGSPSRFVAPDYDVLADNPVTMGLFRFDEYEVDGVPHTIVYRSGPWAFVDRNAVVDHCKRISEAQSKFWGGLPFKKYVWHFRMTDSLDGAGGLEHLSSTEISLAIGLGPGAVSVLSHELFHAWNVKRIRSSVLGPFNYLELPQTGALWLLEGVTDYYADLLLTRYEHFDEPYFYSSVISNVRTTRANEQRKTVSPYESSFRVRDAANGRGNSQGYGVNYYNTGWVAGMCLDIELRRRTGGSRSLDDVMHILWEQTKDNKPGFPEDGIRKALIRVGGPAMGDVYDQWIMKPGELPVEEQLSKVGLQLIEEDETYVTSGLTFVTSATGEGARITRIDGPAEGVVVANDVLLEANGIKFTDLLNRKEGQVLTQKLNQSLKAGEAITLKIRREGQDINVQLTPVSATRKRQVIKPLPTDNSLTKQLRQGWLFGK